MDKMMTRAELKRAGWPLPREGHARLCYRGVTIFRAIGSRYYRVTCPPEASKR